MHFFYELFECLRLLWKNMLLTQLNHIHVPKYLTYELLQHFTMKYSFSPVREFGNCRLHSSSPSSTDEW